MPAAEGAIRPESLRYPIPHLRDADIGVETALWRDLAPFECGQPRRRRCKPAVYPDAGQLSGKRTEGRNIGR
jgi:hypothetical protein